jgi:hypothetical protein
VKHPGNAISPRDVIYEDKYDLSDLPRSRIGDGVSAALSLLAGPRERADRLSGNCNVQSADRSRSALFFLILP